MRALAWWHATPQLPGKLSLSQPVQRLSRRELATQSGNHVDMPHIDPAVLFMVQLLFDAGPVSGGGGAPVPLSWADLEAWQRLTGASVPPWQLRILRRLSAEYLAESNHASEHDAPPPWARSLSADRRAKVAGHIRNVIRG